MTRLLFATSIVALAFSVVGLVLSVRLAGRYRQLRTALAAAGILLSGPRTAGETTDDSGMPPEGSRVPEGLRMTTTGGEVLDGDYFGGADVPVVFLMDHCVACDEQLSDLFRLLAELPPHVARPIVVLSGSPEANRGYRKVLEPVAHVVEDGQVKSGSGVVMAFQVRAFPAILVVGGGVVRRTAADVEHAVLAMA